MIGNTIPDVFESNSNDSDGDLINDNYDVDFVDGDDNNDNGIIDQAEAQLNPGTDANLDGLVDYYSTEVQQDEGQLATPSNTDRNEVIYTLDYENGKINSGVNGVEALSPSADDAIRISSSFSRSGTYSINHRVEYSDQYASAGAWRAESNTIDLRKSRYDQGDMVRYKFSVFLDSTWLADDERSVDLIWQWKRFSSPPDMFVLIRGQNIELRALQGSKGIRRSVLKNYCIGEWIDLQFDVEHSAQDDGSVKIYSKYANEPSYRFISEYDGPNMLASGPVDSTYIKWGLYKPAFDQSLFPSMERSIYHDEITVESLGQ